MWRAAGRALAGLALYTLRLLLAPPSTATGLRRWVLNATPLPEPPVKPQEITATVIPLKDKPRRRAVSSGPRPSAGGQPRPRHSWTG